MSSYIRYTLIPGLLVLVIFYLTCLVKVDSIPVPERFMQFDKIAHFGMFFVLSISIYFDYYRLHKGDPNRLRWVLFGLIIPVIYGGLIEIVQQKYFGRSGDFFDFAADSLGSLTATGLAFFYINKKKVQ